MGESSKSGENLDISSGKCENIVIRRNIFILYFPTESFQLNPKNSVYPEPQAMNPEAEFLQNVLMTLSDFSERSELGSMKAVDIKRASEILRRMDLNLYDQPVTLDQLLDDIRNTLKCVWLPGKTFWKCWMSRICLSCFKNSFFFLLF